MLLEKSAIEWALNFEELLFLAQGSDEKATELILDMYRGLLIKNSIIRGRFDEDLYQELVVEVLKCINYFQKRE